MCRDIILAHREQTDREREFEIWKRRGGSPAQSAMPDSSVILKTVKNESFKKCLVNWDARIFVMRGGSDAID